MELGWEAYEAGHYGEAFSLWQTLAEQGHALAQVNLGAMYDAGQGVTQNLSKAFELFRKAAQNGNPYAQYNLGNMYAEGRGTSRDIDQAKTWYLKAAQQDLAIAQYSIGLLYADAASQTGQLATNDREIAIQWFYKSGLSHLKNNDLEGARLAQEEIADLAADHPTAKQLKHKIGSTQLKSKSKSPVASFSDAAFGTGWPISCGHVITNNHVISSSDEILLLDTSGQQIKARPILRDEVNDIAVLEVSDIHRLPPAIPLATSNLDVGTAVFTIGFPRVDVMGVKPKLTDGVISKLSGLADDNASCQTTVPIQPGNSGGPLLNMKGEAVGVMRSMIGMKNTETGETLVFKNASSALKIGMLSDILSSLPQNRAFIQTLPSQAASLQDLTQRIKDSMLIVVAQ
jgi:S1-C subfamily serine protease